MTNRVSNQTDEINLAEISRKTGLIVRQPDSISSLFDGLEGYELQERAETYNYLKRALNETRSSLGAEAVYRDE
jgi:hypothetical protein